MTADVPEQPPMNVFQLADHLAGVLEDEGIPSDRATDIAMNITASWLKDRRRAIKHYCHKRRRHTCGEN